MTLIFAKNKQKQNQIINKYKLLKINKNKKKTPQISYENQKKNVYANF